jgi:repressor LexA
MVVYPCFRGDFMGIGKRVKEARERLRLTQKELGDIIGVTASAVTNYENETSHPKEPIMYALIDALKVDANYLFQDMMPELKNIASPAALSPAAQRVGRAYEKATPPVQRTVEVALEPFMEEERVDKVIYVDFSKSEQPASAGTGVYLDDESMETISVRADALPKDYDRYHDRYFGVSVSGDSMEPKYHDGDTLIVSKEPVNVGDVGVFTLDDEGYVKQLGRGVLHSLNPLYPDIPLTENITCNGKVVGVLKA